MNISTIVALVSFGIIAVLLANSNANNVTFGVVGRYSRLLDQRYVRVKHSILSVKEETVVFPAKGQYNYFPLAAVRVIDHKKKDGGRVSLRSGGPGAKNATIHLKSDRGHGLDYTILYYAN